MSRRVIYAVKLYNGDNKHPDSLFATGNKKTLGKPGIGDKVYQFYKENYAKSKLKMVTICNKDYSENLKRLISRDEVAIPDHRPPQKVLKAPIIKQNKLILLKSQTTKIRIHKYFDIKDPIEYSYLDFLTSVLDNVLTANLIEEEPLADSLETSFYIYRQYTEVDIDIYLSFKGKQKLQPVLDVVYGALNSLDQLFSEEIFDEIKEESKRSFNLRSKSTDASTTSEDILRKFMVYGFDRIFEGRTILEVNFDKLKIEEVWNNLKKAKSLIVVLGNYKSTYTKGKSLKEGIDLEGSQKLGDLSSKYTVDQLLERPLFPYNYLDLKEKSEQKKEEEKLPKIDFFHPMLLMSSGYVVLDDRFDHTKKMSLKYSHNPFSKVSKVLSTTTQKDKEVVLDLSTTTSFYSRYNSRYRLHSLSMFLDLFINEGTTKEVNTHLQLLSIILGKRFQLLNEKLDSCKSQVYFSIGNRRLTINIDSLIGSFNTIADVVLKKIFNGPGAGEFSISENEKKFALDKLYEDTKAVYSVKYYGRAAEQRFTALSIQQTRSEMKAYLKKLDKTGIPVPKMMVGRLYTEGYITSLTNDYIIKKIAETIDSSFNPKSEFDSSKYDYDFEGFSRTETVVLVLNTANDIDKNEAYFHVFRTHKHKDDKHASAVLGLLTDFLNKRAYDYLRTDKQLGYDVRLSASIRNKEIFIVLFVETTKIVASRAEFENFYRRMEKEIPEISDEAFKIMIENTISDMRAPYSNLYSEAQDNYDNFSIGIRPDYSLDMANYLENGNVKKEDLVSAYLNIFRCKTAEKIIVDTFIGKKSQSSYNVGGNPYIVGEKYKLVYFED